MKTFDILTKTVNFIFWILLPAIMLISAFVYWTVSIEPQMRLSTKNNFSIWAYSNAYSIAAALNPFTADSPDQDVQDVEKLLYAIHMLKDHETGIRFIPGIKLEMNYNLINTGKDELDITAGETSCDECFVTKVPLHSTVTKVLMGYATFYHNGEFFRRIRDDMKSKLLKFSGMYLAFLIVVWGILTVKIRSITEADNQIQKQRAELAGAERLRSLGEIATGIAHEINQPLTIINLLTGNIADNCDEEHYEILKKF
ncbi:MAG: hypothetical protein GY795_04105, partial [Desulfobacterales bacterium]|nr:hypothetical protein [Desulfobacterales bacterium]